MVRNNHSSNSSRRNINRQPFYGGERTKPNRPTSSTTNQTNDQDVKTSSLLRERLLWIMAVVAVFTFQPLIGRSLISIGEFFKPGARSNYINETQTALSDLTTDTAKESVSIETETKEQGIPKTAVGTESAPIAQRNSEKNNEKLNENTVWSIDEESDEYKRWEEKAALIRSQKHISDQAKEAIIDSMKPKLFPISQKTVVHYNELLKIQEEKELDLYFSLRASSFNEDEFDSIVISSTSVSSSSFTNDLNVKNAMLCKVNDISCWRAMDYPDNTQFSLNKWAMDSGTQPFPFPTGLSIDLTEYNLTFGSIESFSIVLWSSTGCDLFICLYSDENKRYYYHQQGPMISRKWIRIEIDPYRTIDETGEREMPPSSSTISHIQVLSGRNPKEKPVILLKGIGWVATE